MKENYKIFLNKFSGKVIENEPLKNHSSFKIGGSADIMVFAENTKELVEAIKLSVDLSIPFFILGGGTNVVFHDRGLRGIVIKNLCSAYKVQGTKVYVESGTVVSKFSEEMSKRGLKGLECLGGLPGTVGGAIVGNAGAYGSSIGDVLEEGTLYFLKEKDVKTVKKDFFDFQYRYSCLKNNRTKGVVLSAILQLKEGNNSELISIIEKDRYKRNTQHPTEPSAGCIFKNIKVDDNDFREFIKSRLPGVEKSIVYNKLPAGALMDKMNLKGLSRGGVSVSEIHGNYIVNKSSGTCEDVKFLINLIKEKVKYQSGVELEEEVLFIPENL